MGYTEDQVLGTAVRKRLVRLVRDHAGAFPGEDLLDLHSPDGFLGVGMAQRAPNWYFFTGVVPHLEPDNLEHRELDLPELPFPDTCLAAVVGAFLTEPFEHWSPEIVDELHRVLVPKGRVLFMVRGPSARAPDVVRCLPEGIHELLAQAGFKGATEQRVKHLMDGSEILLIEGTMPW